MAIFARRSFVRRLKFCRRLASAASRCGLQRGESFPQELECALEAAAAGRPIRSRAPELSGAVAAQDEAASRFRLCQVAAGVIERSDRDCGTRRQPVAAAAVPDLPWARELLAAIEQRITDGNEDLAGLLPAVRAEIAVAAAECDADATTAAKPSDPLFRLRIGRWGMANEDLAGLICLRDPRLRVLEEPWPGGTSGELLARMEQDVSWAGNAYIWDAGDRLVRWRPD